LKATDDDYNPHLGDWIV